MGLGSVWGEMSELEVENAGAECQSGEVFVIPQWPIGIDCLFYDLIGHFWQGLH